MTFEWQEVGVTFLSSEFLFQGWVSGLFEDWGRTMPSPSTPALPLLEPAGRLRVWRGEDPLDSSRCSGWKDRVLGCLGRKGCAGFDRGSGSQEPTGTAGVRGPLGAGRSPPRLTCFLPTFLLVASVFSHPEWVWSQRSCWSYGVFYVLMWKKNFFNQKKEAQIGEKGSPWEGAAGSWPHPSPGGTHWLEARTLGPAGHEKKSPPKFYEDFRKLFASNKLWVAPWASQKGNINSKIVNY